MLSSEIYLAVLYASARGQLWGVASTRK